VSTPSPQTLMFGTAVYGDEPPADDDPVEAFHEASRFYPDVVDTSRIWNIWQWRWIADQR